MSPHLLRGAHHDGKRLMGPVFPLAQPLDSLWICGVARKLKSPQALESQDAAGPQKPASLAENLAVSGNLGDRLLKATVFSGWRHPLETWATCGAGIGLGMEAAVGWIVVFGLTRRAHAEFPHGGTRAVIGDVLYDGETGAAVGAIGEGVTIPAVLGIKDLPDTHRTASNIRRHNSDCFPMLHAMTYLKRLVAYGLQRHGIQGFDERLRGLFALDAV
jgi:hypothetical protein